MNRDAKSFKKVTGYSYSSWANKWGLNHHTVRKYWLQGFSNLVKITKNSHKHPLRSTWTNMKSRCYNSNNNHYHYYGGRGITVCSRWFYSFEAFCEDMGERPKGYSLERLDNYKNYSQENCIWADIFTQAQNKRTRKDCKSGITGIHYCQNSKKWILQKQRSKQRIHKAFKTKEEAINESKKIE